MHGNKVYVSRISGLDRGEQRRAGTRIREAERAELCGMGDPRASKTCRASYEQRIIIAKNSHNGTAATAMLADP